MDAEAFSFGSFRLMPTERRFFDGDRLLRLGNRAFDLLVALVERAGKTVGADELMSRAWPDAVVDEGALRVNISVLRKILRDGRDGNRFIINVPGRGYRFVAAATNERVFTRPLTPVKGGGIWALLPSVVGRSDVVATLTEQVARRRLVTIVGPGGIGKTTVAAAVSEAARALYADGVWFVGLASLSGSELVVGTLAATLEISLPVTHPVPALKKWLADKHALIVFDNCEHVIDTVAALALEIVKAAPRLSVLATSREPLRTQGEWRYRLAPLAYPQSSAKLSVADAMSYPAVQLLHERAIATTDEFVIGDDDIPAVVQICRKLDGVPLALELAAAHVGVLGVKGLAARLDDRFALLVQGRRTALPRHQTLRATLDWSYGLLPEAEQVILRRLSVFRGDFTIAAAIAVAADAQLTRGPVVNGIANLADKSLLAADIGGDVTWYRLLDTTRAYAFEKLAASGELESARRKHARFYAEDLEHAESDWLLRSVEDWRAIYRREIDNIRGAFDWAFSERGDPDLAVMLVIHAMPMLADLALIRERQQYAEKALRLVREGAPPDPRAEMLLLTALQATRVYTEGPSAPSLAAWERVLQLATELGDRIAGARAIWGLWNDNIYGGTPALALSYARRFLDEPNPTHALLAHRMMAISLHYMGNQPEARARLSHFIAQYDRSAHRVRSLGRHVDHGVAGRATLVRILWLQGEPDEALRLANHTIAEAFAADFQQVILYVLVEASVPLSMAIGDNESAERYLQLLVQQAARSGYMIWHIYGRCFHEMLRIRRGDHNRNLPSFIDAIEELRSSGFCAHLPMLLGLLAAEQAKTGDIANGLTTIDEAIDWSGSRELHWYGPELLRIKAEIILQESSDAADARAEVALRQSLGWARRQGALSWELRTATSLARLLRRRGYAESVDRAGSRASPAAIVRAPPRDLRRS